MKGYRTDIVSVVVYLTKEELKKIEKGEEIEQREESGGKGIELRILRNYTLDKEGNKIFKDEEVIQ